MLPAPLPLQLLNDYAPDAGQWRGGLSWLSNEGTILLSSHQASDNGSAPLAQSFGVGYYTKVGRRLSLLRSETRGVGQAHSLACPLLPQMSQARGITLRETIAAPFGDWPLLFTEVHLATTLAGAHLSNA